MNILVTGGAGYIGSHVCKALAAAGLTPITYDNLSLGHREAVRWGSLEEGDVCDGAHLHRVLTQHNIEGVVHLAGVSLVGESMRAPEKYYRNNAVGTLTLLEAMRECGIKPIVFSGTAAVYGIPAHVPISEDAPLMPISPYGASKLAAEHMLRDFGAAHGTRWASLRYFNAAGADPEAEIGEDHATETHLIPLVLAAAQNGTPITVFGRDYDTPDGTCIRDYIHVADLAEAHVLALRALMKDAAPFAANLGTGEGVSVAEVIETARKVTGKPISTTSGPRREGDPPVLVAQCRRAEVLFGWKPQRSDIRTIIEDAWQWHRKHFARSH